MDVCVRVYDFLFLFSVILPDSVGFAPIPYQFFNWATHLPIGCALHWKHIRDAHSIERTSSVYLYQSCCWYLFGCHSCCCCCCCRFSFSSSLGSGFRQCSPFANEQNIYVMSKRHNALDSLVMFCANVCTIKCDKYYCFSIHFFFFLVLQYEQQTRTKKKEKKKPRVSGIEETCT